ncbi:MAG: hypothetical protein KF858_07015 [Candidatus Sumerlaeia bacterium]|nr:hypothetical protein [Candidatus Sumerlaeia bacterium]
MSDKRTEAEREVDRLRIERNLRLSVEERLNQGTINPFRPGIDDGPKIRVWHTMAERKAWQETLPKYLGYGQAKDED